MNSSAGHTVIQDAPAADKSQSCQCGQGSCLMVQLCWADTVFINDQYFHSFVSCTLFSYLLLASVFVPHWSI